jgi:DNA mismatch repair ATPase MutS
LAFVKLFCLITNLQVKSIDLFLKIFKFKKNIIITGPNASGKTTTLKTALMNIIITQQVGYGFYKNATIQPYKYIHCYLNIPDTSGRDSLFQAEARRCKEILDIVQDNNRRQTHFCVFDELYSGTNPDEAVLSAHAFMKYLIKFKNVNCILTTHFIDLCKKLDTNDSIENYHMSTNKSGNDFNYSYLLKKGISNIKGGVKVLCDMNYPKEIIDNTINLN